MKNYLKYAILACLVLSAGACQTETVPVIEESFSYKILVGGDTRAVFSEDHIAWEAGDKVGWFTDKEGSSQIDMSSTPRSFTVSSNAALSAGSKIYAYAPFKASGQSKDDVTLSIPAAQDQTGAEYDADAMPLVAIPVEIKSSVASGSDTPVGEAKFYNLGAMIRYNVYTTSSEYASEVISSVAFKATEPIAGEFSIDLTEVSRDDVPDLPELSDSKVVTTLSETVGSGKANAVEVYQVIAPGIWSGTITVQTDRASYDYSITDVEFPRSSLRPIALDLASKNVARKVQNPEVESMLAATQWVLKDVMESGESVPTSTFNKLTLNSDSSMSFDCSANEGQTFDHTWAGELIDPDAYGDVSDMGWWAYTSGGKDYVEVDNGFLLVFAQESMTGVYEIKELSDSRLTVEITSYEEVWTLSFEAANAAGSETEDLLTAHPWVLKGVHEEGGSVTTSVGNKLTLNKNHTMSFDCSANGGKTFDHTWEGGLISPDAYGAVEDMRWSVSSAGTLTVTNGFLLVFAQTDVNGEYEIKELTDSKLTVDIVTEFDWGSETWTLLFEEEGTPPEPGDIECPYWHTFADGDFGIGPAYDWGGWTDGYYYDQLTNPAVLDGAVWSISDAGYFEWAGTEGWRKGIQLGANSVQVSNFTLASSSFPGTITGVTLGYNAPGNVSGITVSCTVGGESFGSPVTHAEGDYEAVFTGSASGEIIIRIESPKKAPIYLYYLNIEFAPD